VKLWQATDFPTCKQYDFLQMRGVWRVMIIRQHDDYTFDLLKPGIGRDDGVWYFHSPRWLIVV